MRLIIKEIPLKMLAEEGEEVVEAVKAERDAVVKAKEEQAEALENASTSSERTPQDYHDAIQELPTALNDLLQAASEATGWVFHLLAAGPSPISNGEIASIEQYFGPTSTAGNTFSGAHPSYRDHVEKPFLNHIKGIFPHDVRVSRALRAASSLPSIDLHGLTPMGSPSSPKHAVPLPPSNASQTDASITGHNEFDLDEFMLNWEVQYNELSDISSLLSSTTPLPYGPLPPATAGTSPSSDSPSFTPPPFALPASTPVADSSGPLALPVPNMGVFIPPAPNLPTQLAANGLEITPYAPPAPTLSPLPPPDTRGIVQPALNMPSQPASITTTSVLPSLNTQHPSLSNTSNTGTCVPLAPNMVPHGPTQPMSPFMTILPNTTTHLNTAHPTHLNTAMHPNTAPPTTTHPNTVHPNTAIHPNTTNLNTTNLNTPPQDYTVAGPAATTQLVDEDEPLSTSEEVFTKRQAAAQKRAGTMALKKAIAEEKKKALAAKKKGTAAAIRKASTKAVTKSAPHAVPKNVSERPRRAVKPPPRADRSPSPPAKNGEGKIVLHGMFAYIPGAELAEALHSQIEDPRAHIKGVCLGIVKHSDNMVQEAASNSDQNGGRFWQARTEPKPRPAPKMDPKWTGNLMPSSTRFAKLSRLDFAKFSRLEHTVIFAKLFYLLPEHPYRAGVDYRDRTMGKGPTPCFSHHRHRSPSSVPRNIQGIVHHLNVGWHDDPPPDLGAIQAMKQIPKEIGID
ncbi:hypothetical protein D9615_008461 [Tricholomella constricta]|uniref:Uncharacterized protein n=1 Tax=Tricholomella constricta TaxID=117010 RepID=A0A8H5H422_9AGAR|nr:hypothetical protein D9615_008461 [Tricholomella constricta]